MTDDTRKQIMATALDALNAIKVEIAAVKKMMERQENEREQECLAPTQTCTGQS